MQCIGLAFRIRDSTSKFLEFRQKSEKVKLRKRVVLYPALNPKHLDVEQLTLSMTFSTSIRATIVRPC